MGFYTSTELTDLKIDTFWLLSVLIFPIDVEECYSQLRGRPEIARDFAFARSHAASMKLFSSS